MSLQKKACAQERKGLKEIPLSQSPFETCLGGFESLSGTVIYSLKELLCQKKIVIIQPALEKLGI